MIKFFNNICVSITLGISFYSCNKEISVSSPDSPPSNGFILVDSKPEGFQIYLNNKDSGRMTPDSLIWLSSGTYLFTLKKLFYKDTSVTASVVEGKKHSVYVDVSQNQSMLGSLYCSSYPDKAKVFINDSSTGQVTPYLFNLLPGNYNIVYCLKNHSDAGEQLSITSGNRTYSKVILTDTTSWKHYIYETSFIPSHSLTCVVASGSSIIVGTSDISIFSFDELRNKVIPYPNRLNNNVNCLKFSKNGNLYIGTKGGMVVFNGAGFIEYGPTNTSWPDYNIHAIVIDNTGTCIVGTDKGVAFTGGLSYLDGSGWKNVYPIPSQSRTNVIFIDQNNVKWVTTNAGLDINNVNGVTGDSRGNIWITTSSELYRYKHSN